MFPVSISLGVYRAGKGKRQVELITFGIAAEFTLLGQLFQGGAERFGANSAEFAQLLHREDRFLELGQGGTDALDGSGFGFGLGARRSFHHRQSQGRTGLSELERDMVLGRSGAMFGGQGQLASFAAHVEIGVAPAMEFTGTAQGLAWTAAVGVLARVMNQEDGQLKLALQFPKIGEQGRDLSGVILIDPVKSDQGVQDQEGGLEILDGVGRRWRSAGVSRPERGSGDDFDGQRRRN